ncbi:MAG: peptide chain release factor 2 [Candidatus Dormibacteraeota bacterium]|nr:peptide chain release factor 2 [Candidatus Dormibacteraeota bacterium]MBV9525316.1 peptide chain release factor 2 [Candidatus Dormibacteraeota bacterium]
MFDLAGKRARVAELDSLTAAPDLWDDPRRAAGLTQEAARLREEIEGWETLSRRGADARDIAGLVDTEPDEGVEAELTAELDALEKELGRREIEVLFSDPYTDHPALLSVHAGAGGTDSQDWAEMLLRMYLRWAEERRFSVDFIEESAGEEAGIKSATVRVAGPRAFGLLKSERGVHRLVRLSPFDSAHRRHTSFALVEVTPEIADESVDVEINPDDVRVDVFRSSGAGGQHVNKTSSAVRLTHMPTGIVVTCQNERSQQQNRDVAWRVLRSRLVALQQAAHAQHIAELKGESLPAEWGSQIRSYVLHPYTMVKDHRTGVEVGNTQAVLDGGIDPFIEGFLRWSAREPVASG